MLTGQELLGQLREVLTGQAGYWGWRAAAFQGGSSNSYRVSMGLSRQEYWNRLPFPSLGDIPVPGIEAGSPADSLPSETRGKP